LARIFGSQKIGASTPYDFDTRNLTAYGGLLPVDTMLENLGLQQLVEETLTIRWRTRSMSGFGFLLGMVLACYVGFAVVSQFETETLPGLLPASTYYTISMKMAATPFWQV
jgi:hypothetical protein